MIPRRESNETAGEAEARENTDEAIGNHKQLSPDTAAGREMSAAEAVRRLDFEAGSEMPLRIGSDDEAENWCSLRLNLVIF